MEERSECRMLFKSDPGITIVWNCRGVKISAISNYT